MPSPGIEVENVSHSYGARRALTGVSFAVEEGRSVALLGPNGGGKTTLLRILATLLVPTSGTARIVGADVRTEPQKARKMLGVVFQSPGLDKKLTVAENLGYQARLTGIGHSERAGRIVRALEATGIAARRDEKVEKLSGGLARRADLARAFLARPRVLLLDEPTVGLDPSARRDFWQAASALRDEVGATILYTTHLTEEAQPADRVGLVDRGRLEAFDTPEALTASIGGDLVTVRGGDPEVLARGIEERLGWKAAAQDGAAVFEHPRGAEVVARLAEAFPGLGSISVARPTLEDVFLRRTGRRMDATGEEAGR
ncbi:MAG: ABC transporter ATP-binding protein [Acidobacteriota bacterium]